jgi:hypothetical protein
MSKSTTSASGFGSGFDNRDTASAENRESHDRAAIGGSGNCGGAINGREEAAARGAGAGLIGNGHVVIRDHHGTGQIQTSAGFRRQRD